jgi:hypothetical protein
MEILKGRWKHLEVFHKHVVRGMNVFHLYQYESGSMSI